MCFVFVLFLGMQGVGVGVGGYGGDRSFTKKDVMGFHNVLVQTFLWRQTKGHFGKMINKMMSAKVSTCSSYRLANAGDLGIP